MMLGADGQQLTLDRPQWPVKTFTVAKFGEYKAKRTTEKEGACGLADYPCTHWGVDMSAPEGTQVVVPFSGSVLYYGPADKPPFEGYGPWVALIAHGDRHTPLLQRVKEWATGPLVDILDFPEGATSVRYSLIAHLAPVGDTGGEIDFTKYQEPMLPMVAPATVPPHKLVGDIWDAAKVKPDPAHWRPQKTAPSNVVMYSDADGATMGRAVLAGQPLGRVSNKNHVHWELRTAPIQPAAKGTWRIDPLRTFAEAYGVTLPSGVSLPGAPARTEEAAQPSGGGGGLLLLGAALMFGGKKKRRRR